MHQELPTFLAEPSKQNVNEIHDRQQSRMSCWLALQPSRGRQRQELCFLGTETDPQLHPWCVMELHFPTLPQCAWEGSAFSCVVHRRGMRAGTARAAFGAVALTVPALHWTSAGVKATGPTHLSLTDHACVHRPELGVPRSPRHFRAVAKCFTIPLANTPPKERALVEEGKRRGLRLFSSRECPFICPFEPTAPGRGLCFD